MSIERLLRTRCQWCRLDRSSYHYRLDVRTLAVGLERGTVAGLSLELVLDAVRGVFDTPAVRAIGG